MRLYFSVQVSILSEPRELGSSDAAVARGGALLVAAAGTTTVLVRIYTGPEDFSKL